ncbi:MAG: DNA alkylation repair protein [Balneola sp.]
MAEPLKNLYNEKLFDILCRSCEEIIPDFNRDHFLDDIYDQHWDQRELKERLRHITVSLKKQLPDDYPAMINLVIDLIPALKKNGAPADTFEYAFLPDFVQLCGVNHPEESLRAMEQLTQFVTCEFAIRPFLIQYPERMVRQMLVWSEHEHPSVRRLASEGFRPRLPWALGVPALKKDPTPILAVLEKLKNDPSETVRRSVANNLNDISKDHPELVIEIAKRWIGHSEHTNKLVKHACRTLLKQGNQEILQLFGYGSTSDVELSDFRVQTPKVNIGENLEFTFHLKNKSDSPTKIRLEYGIYFLRANGSHSKKVFKISEKEYDGNSSTQVDRSQTFRPITTRVYYTGLHKLSVIVNGIESQLLEFELRK